MSMPTLRLYCKETLKEVPPSLNLKADINKFVEEYMVLTEETLK